MGTELKLLLHFFNGFRYTTVLVAELYTNDNGIITPYYKVLSL